MRIGLFVGQLGLRGTDQFVFNLADICQSTLGHFVVIISHRNQPTNKDVTQQSQAMFRSHFFTVFKEDHECLDDIAQRYRLDAVYISKWGTPDDLVTVSVPCIVHAIFSCATPHGHVYVGISDYMKQKCKSACDVLPFCVSLKPKTFCLRQQLGIPQHAFVYGRLGGYHQFDVPFAQQAVKNMVEKEPIYVIFLNTFQFMPSSERVFFLPGHQDLQVRSNFVHACDAMIHARSDGETFSLACGEFSLANKPVITTNLGDQAHVHILYPNVFVASDAATYQLCMIKARLATQSFDAYKQFTPALVANTFERLLHKAVQLHGTPKP